MNEDYRYQGEKRSVGADIARDIIQLLIIIGGVIALRYIIVALPMVKEYTGLIGLLSVDEIIIAGAWTLIIIALIIYGFRFEVDIMGDNVERADLGKIVQLIFLFVAILIAYFTYKSIAEYYLIDKYWIYTTAMLVLALIPIIFLGVVIYRNTDRVAAAIVKAGSGKPRAAKVKVSCPGCNTPLPGKMKFCPQCGGNVEQLFVVQESFCPACGQKYQKGQGFCAGCGQKFG